MMIEMITPRYASKLIPVAMYIIAATRVDVEMIESKSASFPDATSESELILFP